MRILYNILLLIFFHLVCLNVALSRVNQYNFVSNDTININDLGVNGDEEKNDTYIIQKAINKYKTVYLPKGKYLVSSLALKQGTTLVGDGIDKTFIIAINNDSIAFKYSHGIITLDNEAFSDISISGLTIDGNKKNQKGSENENWEPYGYFDGIRIGKVNNQVHFIKLNNIDVLNCPGSGITAQWCDSLFIENIITHNNATFGIFLSGKKGQEISNSILRYIRTYDNTSYNKYIAYDGILGIYCQHCVFDSIFAYGTSDTSLYNGFSGLKFVNSSYNKFSNVICNKNQWSGLHISGDVGGKSIGNRFYNCVFKNNIKTKSGAGNGVLITGESDSTLFNNCIFENNERASVWLNSSFVENTVFNRCKFIKENMFDENASSTILDSCKFDSCFNGIRAGALGPSKSFECKNSVFNGIKNCAFILNQGSKHDIDLFLNLNLFLGVNQKIKIIN